MKKTPMGENALLILMTHYMKHNTLNFNLYINCNLLMHKVIDLIKGRPGV